MKLTTRNLSFSQSIEEADLNAIAKAANGSTMKNTWDSMTKGIGNMFKDKNTTRPSSKPGTHVSTSEKEINNPTYNPDAGKPDWFEANT